MVNPDSGPVPEKDVAQFDSLNIDIVEPTDVVVDNTVRPMRDSLRKWLKLPPYDKPPPTGQPPQEPRPDKPSS
jgi:hypothetical protein